MSTKQISSFLFLLALAFFLLTASAMESGHPSGKKIAPVVAPLVRTPGDALRVKPRLHGKQRLRQPVVDFDDSDPGDDPDDFVKLPGPHQRRAERDPLCDFNNYDNALPPQSCCGGENPPAYCKFINENEKRIEDGSDGSDDFDDDGGKKDKDDDE